MTRDTIRVHGDRDSASDAEIHAALWAVAPFPRLPDDAPTELKNLTIDIDDPKRVYAIHRASRRHNFQILVERYILQIRYGCQSKTCHTSTCFSSRKRIAAGAPVRRYNATSARTLAVYLASQDNPEQGLCHHASASRPNREATKTSKPRGLPLGDLKTSSASQDSRRQSGTQEQIKSVVAGNLDLLNSIDSSSSDMESKRQTSINGIQQMQATPDLSVVEEPATTDHRSFVQNMFGTVTFRMLEWLTPRNFELLAKSQQSVQVLPESLSKPETLQEGPARKKEVVDDSSGKTQIPVQETPVPEEKQPHRKKSGDPKPVIDATSTVEFSKPKPLTAQEATLQPNFDSRSPPKPPLRRSDSMPRRRTGSLDSHNPKSILNKVPKTAEVMGDITSLSSRPLGTLPKQKLPRQNLITSPKLHVTEAAPLHGLVPLPTNSKEESEEIAKPKEDKEERKGPDVQDATGNLGLQPRQKQSPKPTPVNELSMPQSMSSLPIEIIELLCDIMQADGTSEPHFLEPQSINESLKRQKQQSTTLARRPTSQSQSQYPSLGKQEWRTFIEQCFFDVLGKPDSLLQSFRDEEEKLFDTQTIWYILLRMTRVAPSVVFDSLWTVAGTLFRPPEKLESALEWAKDSRNLKSLPSKAVSNNDAAIAINICLHALVAAAPLVSDARQLANMSRIRSYGLAMLGRESSSLEPVALCLQYEDAFSNELAVRLARRLFAAIPTRRRFAELLDLQKDIRSEENHEPDILENILGTLKFLDLGTPPVLDFPDHERDLHEKRVPTLILDWARTVMLQDWQGTAEVPSDGPFGGALATMAAIYKNRKSLLLGDIHFRTEYFAQRLDPVEMPLEWISFVPNKRTVHLLDHPYLFNPSTLVTYFRAINYSRMNQSYEEAKATNGLIYTIVQESLMSQKHRRDRLADRLRTATSRFMVLEIRRDNVLVDTFNSIWRREERELMRPLKIRLGEAGGEEGLDSGGVQQEFFRLAIAEALDPDYGTFTIDSRTKMTWFQPGSPEPLWKFELVGMIMSLAIYNGLTLPVTFPKALYRKLLDDEVTELHHIADGWPDLANGLTTLLEWDEKDGLVEDVFTRTYEFSVEQFGQPVSCEMGTTNKWPQFSDLNVSPNPEDAPLVTNENRNNYVSDYIRWLTDVSIQPQYEAFKTGFFACIDRRSIGLFDPETLQSVVEGIQEIDISEMRRATRYIGWDASHRSVRDFWSIVKRYDIEQKRKLLEFVTASDRVPVGGMRNLQFTVQRNGVDDGHLPSSYTCYGILLLPEYSSKEVLREKLHLALENSKGFGFA